MQQIGTVQHVQCHMGCPMGGMFDNEQLATWTKAVGVAGINGFGWGQLSHIMSWVFQVTKLQPASAFAFMRRSVRCKPHHATPRHAIPCAFVRAVADAICSCVCLRCTQPAASQTTDKVYHVHAAQ
jgi:hypothetical protein